MARPESSLSKALERSMNNQCRHMTMNECLRNDLIIDKLDDERREQSFKNTEWHRNMRKSYHKRLKSFLDQLLEYGVPIDLLSVGIQINNDSKEHDEMYFKKVNELQEKELFFEEQSDDLRDYMIRFNKKALEMSRLESSDVEKTMMEENLMKRLNK